MSKNRYSPLKTAGIFLVLLGMVGAAAHGQTKNGAALKDRNKEEMHKHTPVKLMGLEEGNNSFRDRTPLLEQSDKAPALVDVQENYNRKKAMYEKGKTFSTPLAPATAGLTISTAGSRTGKPDQEAGVAGSARFWVLMVLIMLVVVFLILNKKKGDVRLQS